MVPRSLMHDPDIRRKLADHFECEPEQLHISRKGCVRVEGRGIVLLDEIELYETLDKIDTPEQWHELPSRLFE